MTAAQDGPGIAAAGRTAREVLRLARALGRRPGVHRRDDVLLECHLSRSDEASGPLAALLDPLAGRPGLLATLRAYLSEQQDRRATARVLGLHPHTVDNRLARAGELIGVDVTAPRGYALALTALTLRDLRGPA